MPPEIWWGADAVASGGGTPEQKRYYREMQVQFAEACEREKRFFRVLWHMTKGAVVVALVWWVSN